MTEQDPLTPSKPRVGRVFSFLLSHAGHTASLGDIPSRAQVNSRPHLCGCQGESEYGIGQSAGLRKLP